MKFEEPRIGSIDDAERCAEIVHNWIEATEWMPTLYSKNSLIKMIKENIPLREFWVVGDPVSGYISFNRELSQVVGLYVDEPGNGLGKALIDKVKSGRNYIQLWSHSANKAAHHFYYREGFELSAYKENGDDGIPEIQLVWKKAV